MSARDDYPFPAAVADGRINGGLYGQQETSDALDEIDRLRLNPSPSVWPACSECNEAFRLEHRMQMHMEGESWQIRPIWAWMRACKHKKADAVIYDNDGPITHDVDGEVGEVAL